MPAQLLLLSGIACVAAVVGYMAGGSATPVASVAIPAVFGLAVTAIGLLQPDPSRKTAPAAAAASGDAGESAPPGRSGRGRRSTPALVGAALVVFSLAYVGAATLGAKVRIEHWLAPKRQAPEFPWAASDTKPPTIAAALEWLALQARLGELGYGADRIAALYAIQAAEWKSLAARAQETTARAPEAMAASAGASAASAQIEKRAAQDLLREWLKEGAVKGPSSPFANQPPKELTDKLKGLGAPGQGSPGAMPG